MLDPNFSCNAADQTVNEPMDRNTDWDGYSARIASRKQAPEWKVLRDVREQHYDDFFSVRQGETVLDAGCGHGEYTVFALSRGATVSAIDMSERMIAYTKSLCEREDLPLQEISQQSVLDIQYPDDTFDTVYCLSVLECLPDPEAAVRELTRVLKPGGTLYLDVSNAIAVHWRILFIVMQLMNAGPKGNMRYFMPSTLLRMVRDSGCEPVASSGQSFLPPFSGIYTADLRRYTFLPDWLIRPLDRLYLRIERFTNRYAPFKYLCWHYMLKSEKRIAPGGHPDP